MRVDVRVEVPISTSARSRQLEAMFDVPRAETSSVEWHGDIALDDRPWNVGLIVGPSGSGKSTLLRNLFGGAADITWVGDGVIDDFAKSLTMNEISEVCAAVGFNTIPAWLRPQRVLSTGEQFRVDLARRLVEIDDPIVVDEFTSVVDRQVAQIGSNAVQKFARKHDRKFVAASCHYDIIDWLQPDWVLEPATMSFEWRSVQPRPGLDVTISPVPHAAWRLFAPYHYLTAEMHRGARCWCLFVGDQPAAFAGILHRPHATAQNIKGVSRLVTLPDWQGLGLAFVLVDQVAALYKAVGQRTHTYPAHPALIRGFDRSSSWKMTQRPGSFGPAMGKSSSFNRDASNTSQRATRMKHAGHRGNKVWHMGSRPCAVFEYVGDAASAEDAARTMRYWNKVPA